MPEEFVTLERRSDNVAVVRLDRPKMNALSTVLLTQLEVLATQLTADPPGAVVIWGGTKIFAAGADVTELGGPAEARRISEVFHKALDAVALIPRATIAAISGYALGGGCELALACDLRVASDRAKLGQPEILLGIIPGGGGTQRLARLVGPSRAKDLILTGRQVGAEECRRIGLVDRVVPADEVFDSAIEMASGLARGAVVAQGMAKQAIDAGASASLREGMALERKLFGEVFDTKDASIGVASFLEKGPGQARFTGR
ncbi:MAG: enoyl-CoA hydratase/isomerase family protein [Acidimicrobiales bacterium]